MADPALDATASRQDLPAVVEAVGECLAMPAEPRGLLAVCARAVADRVPIGEDVAPAVVRVVLEAALAYAKRCRQCGEVHPARRVTPRGGGQPLLTWDHEADGHRYQEGAPGRAAYWLDQQLNERSTP